MFLKQSGFGLLAGIAFLSLPGAGADPAAGKARRASAESARSESAVLWREPMDLESRNLFYGPGGEKHQPKGPFTFVEEDLNGTNAKYIVRDANKVKWTVKIGMEARPETVATRLVWAAGYFANEDYFLDTLQVQDMPAHLKRGAKQIGPGGLIQAARLKRHLEDQKKVDNWKWRDNPLAGTREINGLKVVMALINNWDLKDVNNEVYAEKDGKEQILMVSDLGASFGTTGLSFPFSRSKGNLNSYIHSKFIGKVSSEFVDFRTPSRPSLVYIGKLPQYLRRLRLDDLAHHIPREDAHWMGDLLSRLSPEQIRDAFRAAGYNQEQIDWFAKEVQGRIAELANL